MNNNITKGTIFILISALGYAGMSMFIKLSGDIPVIQKVFFRNLPCLFLAVFLLAKNKKSILGHKGNRKILFLRGCVGTLGALANFYAVDELMLPNATMLNQLGPFFIIILSFIFLKEKIRKFQIGALAVAFIGVIIILGPGSTMAIFPAFIAILGAVAIGIAFTCIRYLGGKESPETIVFWFAIVSIVTGGIYMVFNYTPMTLMQTIYLIGAGLCTIFGQFGATLAYKYAAAKDISIFGYSQVIFATVFSVLIFAQIPGENSIIGYIIVIIAAGISFFYNKKVDS